MTYPSVYPTGTTIYDPEKCWNGYTIFQAKEVGATLIDMNGCEVQLWQGLHGFPNTICRAASLWEPRAKEMPNTACRTTWISFR